MRQPAGRVIADTNLPRIFAAERACYLMLGSPAAIWCPADCLTDMRVDRLSTSQQACEVLYILGAKAVAGISVSNANAVVLKLDYVLVT